MQTNTKETDIYDSPEQRAPWDEESAARMVLTPDEVAFLAANFSLD
jgi:hypothetical protein